MKYSQSSPDLMERRISVEESAPLQAPRRARNSALWDRWCLKVSCRITLRDVALVLCGLPIAGALVKVVIEALFLRAYLDCVPGELLSEASPWSDTELIVIGNGPLTQAQRKMIRGTRPAQVFRFNGMSNLHPGEPVGHVFVRFVTNQTTPWQYWGLRPPPSFLSVLDALYVPSSPASTRYECDRINEAVGITLLQGRAEDADWYSKRNGLPVSFDTCEPNAVRGSVRHPSESWSSGYLGITHVLSRWPRHTVHIFGMNWVRERDESHPFETEREHLQQLVAQKRIVMHKPRTGAGYHAVYADNFGGEWVQGMKCGEWSPWWFPMQAFAPSRWVLGVIPLPPFFPTRHRPSRTNHSKQQAPTRPTMTVAAAQQQQQQLMMQQQQQQQLMVQQLQQQQLQQPQQQ